MEKKTLRTICMDNLFQIPDYQRGYAWEEKQLKDFVQDIDALIDEKITNHYTGTIVIYQPKEGREKQYGINKLSLVDVVDGQQRLTTCSLYLSIILDKLISHEKKEYEDEISTYLKSSKQELKLELNNDTTDFYRNLIHRTPNTNASTVHQKKLEEAYKYLQSHIEGQTKAKNTKEEKTKYLTDIFDAITRKLNFSFYSIEEESEIGMTFELMNSRGKELSTLELLKNYLMHWTYRNISDKNEKQSFTNQINQIWKEVYINIAHCHGNEEQCLRIAWTLVQSHTPKHWNRYDGFKEKDVIPLRDFTTKTYEDTKQYIQRFTENLAIISKHYSKIINPSEGTSISNQEYDWLTKIRHAGNTANFLPLIVAARIKQENNTLRDSEYIELLKSLEKFTYRVYLWEGKRSNAGRSQFFKWAYEIFCNHKPHIQNIISDIYGLIDWYSTEETFEISVNKPDNWYEGWTRGLKYTLYEYELYLLKEEGTGARPKLDWNDLKDSTIEHILPQNPPKNSDWKKKWNNNDIKTYKHDISNLVLTKDNSHYSNFDFDRKKGTAGTGHCYSNSDIRQERKISGYDDWTVDSCKTRRIELAQWIIERWGIKERCESPTDINDEDDEDTNE